MINPKDREALKEVPHRVPSCFDITSTIIILDTLKVCLAKSDSKVISLSKHWKGMFLSLNGKQVNSQRVVLLIFVCICDSFAICEDIPFPPIKYINKV